MNRFAEDYKVEVDSTDIQAAQIVIDGISQEMLGELTATDTTLFGVVPKVDNNELSIYQQNLSSISNTISDYSAKIIYVGNDATLYTIKKLVTKDDINTIAEFLNSAGITSTIESYSLIKV